METVSVAVVGLGFGRHHVSALAEIGPRAELIAVVDPVPPRENASLRDAPQRDAILAAPHYATLQSLLERAVPDIVAVATPIHTHLALSTQALEAGAHVLLEKPPTATLAEFESLTACAERVGRQVQVGFQARGGMALVALREAMARGDLGRVHGIGVVGNWVRTRGYYERAAWAGRRTLEDGTPVMDGVVTNPLAHAVDTALAVAGALRVEDLESVRIDAWRAHDIEADDTSSLVVRTRDGMTIAAGLTLCAGTHDDQPAITVHGSEGVARLRYTSDRLEFVNPAGEVSVTRFGRTGLLANVVDHIESGDPLIAPIDETGAFMRVLEEARTGQAPRVIESPHVRWEREGSQAHPIVAEVEEWCARAAREGRTFTELGAPWTRPLSP